MARWQDDIPLPVRLVITWWQCHAFLQTKWSFFFLFDVLLTVHLNVFISVINQLDAQNFCFTISLFHASTCFERMCSSSRAPRDGHLQVWWYQRLCNAILTSWWWAHLLETCRGMNKLIVKQKCCASSWLITEINKWSMSIFACGWVEFAVLYLGVCVALTVYCCYFV